MRWQRGGSPWGWSWGWTPSPQAPESPVTDNGNTTQSNRTLGFFFHPARRPWKRADGPRRICWDYGWRRWRRRDWSSPLQWAGGVAFDEFESGEGEGRRGGEEGRRGRGDFGGFGGGFLVFKQRPAAESREIDVPRGCVSPRAKMIHGGTSRGMDAFVCEARLGFRRPLFISKC